MIITKVTWKAGLKDKLDWHRFKYFTKAIELAGAEYENPVSWRELDTGGYEITRAWPNLEIAEAFLSYVRQEDEDELLVSAELSSQ